MNFARTCIYTTALPCASLVAIDVTYRELPRQEDARRKLKAHIASFNMGQTQILPIKMKTNQAAQEASEYLAAQGFDVRPILSPTVAKKDTCLRLVLHAFNTDEEVEGLLQCIKLL